MSNHSLQEICSETGKRMLTRRDAGEIVSLAKTRLGGRGHASIPKGIYQCPSCGMYHTTHYSQSGIQRKATKGNKLRAYDRNKVSKLRVCDYN